MQDTFSNVGLLFIDEHGRSENIHHGQQTLEGDTPTLQGQVIWKSLGGLHGVLQAAATSLRFLIIKANSVNPSAYNLYQLFDKAITFTELVRWQ